MIVDGNDDFISKWRHDNPAGSVIDAPPSSEWPFRFPLCPDLPSGPILLRAANADTAFVNAQSGGTHLVTTQRSYLLEEWKRALEPRGATLVLIGGVDDAISHPLARAFRIDDARGRLAQCVEFLKSGRSPAALVATASACMEVNDYGAAARDLDDAIRQ